MYDSAPSNSQSFDSHIKHDYCHAKGHIASCYLQCTLPLGLVEDVEPNGESNINVLNQWMFLINNDFG